MPRHVSAFHAERDGLVNSSVTTQLNDQPMTSADVLPNVSVANAPPTSPASRQSSPRSPATSSESPSSQFLLPVPSSATNASQASFSLSENEARLFDPLSPEIASADISIAPDGSFVETSSGPAARELKRRFDQHFGVGKSVRSPYAITALVNQFGKQVFRIGHKDKSAVGPSPEEIELMMASKSSASKKKRHSRLSVHALLSPSIFKNGPGSAHISTRPSHQDHTKLSSSGPRRLTRKSRSIPDMYTSASFLSQPHPAQASSLSFTGRTHSYSVTGADMPRLPSAMVDIPNSRAGDMFGDVMHWNLPPSPGSTSHSTLSLQLSADASGSSSSHEHGQNPAIIVQPFGSGVSFDSPSRRPAQECLPAPHHLREMQSFESGLTARQADRDADIDSISTGVSKSKTPSPIPTSELSSDIRSFSNTPDVQEPVEPPYGPAAETSMHSRYSTDVFDVLQTYRGLPLLEKLSPDSEETTVIKLSLTSDETAAPRDDPRFVIWGELRLGPEKDCISISQSSHADLSTSGHSSTASRRKSSKGKAVAAEVPKVRIYPGDSESQKILVAASIERWVAQLTSDLNYDELLIFFLTYRTYISAVDLLHLLICRFHWALCEHTSDHDQTVRRIVRVRTFVAIRYWVVTFFVVDFLSNRELRLLLASWLNVLSRDPVLKKHSDGLSIVRKLKKMAKDCKTAHARTSDKRSSPKPRKKTDHLLGDKFAEATRRVEDSDVDLDFGPDEDDMNANSFPSDPVNAHLAVAHVGAGLATVTNPAVTPSMTILQQSRPSTTGGEADMPFVQTPATLPIHHNSLTRAFTKTMGRLGRWRRVLHSRPAAISPIGACADVSAFDLELTVTRDLLTVNGGVEQYLKMIEQQQATAPSVPVTMASSRVTSDHIALPPLAFDGSRQGHIEPENDSVEPASSRVSVEEMPEDDVLDISAENQRTPPEPEPEQPDPDSEVEPDVPEDAASTRSSSTGSFGVQVASRFNRSSGEGSSQLPPWQFDVVSIDDLDLSDNSSDGHVTGPAAPPGLRRPPRRLPLRRDFEFVQRPESVSSMGINSHHSLASAVSSVMSGSDASGGLGNIQQWQLNALANVFDHDEDHGDVEDALRHLEGQINPQKQQEKSSKIDVWVRSLRERMATGDYVDEQPRLLDGDDQDGAEQSADDGGEDEDENNDGHSVTWSVHNEDVIVAKSSTSQAGSANSQERISVIHAPSEAAETPTAAETPHDVSGPTTHIQSPTPEGAVPKESFPNRLVPAPTALSSVHRSFILNYKARLLAEHFSVIDRELFIGVRFEELVRDDWISCEGHNVLDWGQFLKDRVRWKAENRWHQKTTVLAAVRARFNLMTNFTVSEVVLTQPNERATVVAKLIRVAWQSYWVGNFNTVVAIIAGLRSEWVTKAMRRSWNRVGTYAMRMFNDLVGYTNSTNDFQHIRRTINSLIDTKPQEVGSVTNSSTGATDGQSARSRAITDSTPLHMTACFCVPFIGVYLSQLYRHSKLPDLIDPTAPNEAVSVDPITANFNAPAHPEVFSSLAPLPPSMQLEPLINVQKQRLCAGVIKSLVAGQHLASRVNFPVDKKLFQRCLKLRGLDNDTLQRALAMYPE